MSDEHRGPDTNLLKGLILKKPCPILVALFVCFSVSKGNVQEEPKHFNATLGEDVILFCDFEFPENKLEPYLIEWFKQGINTPIYIWYEYLPPHSAKGYEGRLSLAFMASLNLSNVRQSDQGWYECRVYFLLRPPDSPVNGTWMHLDVYVPPKFTTKPVDTWYVQVGESVELSFNVEGTPPIYLTLYKNTLLDGSKTVHVFTTEESMTFIRINNLQLTDAGNYTLMARNKQGTATATTKVIIEGDLDNRCSALAAGVVIFFFLAVLSMAVGL